MAKVLITPRSYGKSEPELFARLESAGLELVRNETGGILTKAQMIDLIAPCEGVILGVDPMDADVITAAPKLRAIARYGVGLDNVDLVAARAGGIAVSITTGANAEAVADYTMAMMLAVARKLALIDRQCRAGNWMKPVTSDVNNKVLGVLGLGAIGRAVAKRAKGFDMRVLAYDPNWDEAYAQVHGIEHMEVDELMAASDIVTLHLPLLPETREFIDSGRLARMKSGAILINTARGGLVDEEALLEALQSGALLGVGIDAFETEPPTNHAWFALDNVVLGSHCAASTQGATRNMGYMATQNLLRDMGIVTS